MGEVGGRGGEVLEVHLLRDLPGDNKSFKAWSWGPSLGE